MQNYANSNKKSSNTFLPDAPILNYQYENAERRLMYGKKRRALIPPAYRDPAGCKPGRDVAIPL
jgi:hypothetical protein